MRSTDTPGAEAPNIEYVHDKDISYLDENEQAADEYARQQCRLDLYRPTGVTGFPTVVYFHGGGMVNGCKDVPLPLRDRGWAVVGAGYRLSPKVRHPAYIEDSAAAVAWVFKHIADYGGDPKRIFVTGISAGGYLTAMVGLDKSYLAARGVDANAIAGLIPVTGQMITHATVRQEQGIEPSTAKPTIDRFGPLFHIRPDAPPTRCISGGWGVDVYMRAEENLYFMRMMQFVGHQAIDHIVIEGADHGRCGAECWPHVIEFVEKTLADMDAPPAGEDGP